jgi:hypothetical protein
MCPQLDYKMFCLDCYIGHVIGVTVILYLMVLCMHGRAFNKLNLLYFLYNDALGCYWRYPLKAFEVIS